MRFKIVVNPNGLFLFVVTGKSSVIGLHGLLPMIGHRTIIHFGSKVKEVPGSRLWKYQCTLARNLIRIRFWWIGLLRVSPNCCTRIPFSNLCRLNGYLQRGPSPNPVLFFDWSLPFRFCFGSKADKTDNCFFLEQSLIVEFGIRRGTKLFGWYFELWGILKYPVPALHYMVCVCVCVWAWLFE